MTTTAHEARDAMNQRMVAGLFGDQCPHQIFPEIAYSLDATATRDTILNEALAALAEFPGAQNFPQDSVQNILEVIEHGLILTQAFGMAVGQDQSAQAFREVESLDGEWA